MFLVNTNQPNRVKDPARLLNLDGPHFLNTVSSRFSFFIQIANVTHRILQKRLHSQKTGKMKERH